MSWGNPIIFKHPQGPSTLENFSQIVLERLWNFESLACPPRNTPDCSYVSLDHFQELFLENNSKRPVIVLSGVKVADLRAIMQFIYTGEVNVTEVDLPDLLEVAEMLGVRGLKSGADKENGEEEPSKDEQQEQAPVQVTPVKESENITEEITPSISITKVTPSKSETKSPVSSDSFQISVKKDLTSSLMASSEDITQSPEEPHPQSILPDDNIVADEDTNDTDQTDNSFPQPQVPMSAFPAFSSSSYMRPLMNSPVSPLVSMSNLAAMYQHQLTSPTKQFTSPAKHETPGFEAGGKTLEWYRASSQEGKVALDLLPEDINSIMSQSTTPFCPICNKDCANFPNLRSHLQVLSSEQ